MEMQHETMTVNGIEYVRADSVAKSVPATPVDGMPYVIVRTCSAGVFAGYLECRDGKEGAVVRARRLWRWAGAASLSQLAEDGTKDPGGCKFPCEVSRIELTEIIEVLRCTEKARASIAGVPVWAK